MCRRNCCCDLWKYVICWCFYEPVYEDPFDINAILSWSDENKYGASES